MDRVAVQERAEVDWPTIIEGSMHAIVQETYGSADVLRFVEVPRPTVADTDVMIRVHAASVNPADWHFIRGTPLVLRLAGNGLRRPKRQIPGIDVAGVVHAVGKGVTRFRPGDEVLGWCRGAYAEFACASEDHFVSKPARITFEQAAAVPLAGITALQGLRDKGRLEEGQSVLIVGASGGVGTFAVQIAKALGGNVTGVCSTRNTEMVTTIGADQVIDYTSDDFIGGDKRYDLIFQLAGTQSPSACRRVLTRKGTLVLSSGQGRMGGVGRILAAAVTSPFVSQRLVTWVSKQNRADLETVKALIDSGQLTPVVDRSYALRETPDAVRYVEEGHTRGKVVVTV